MNFRFLPTRQPRTENTSKQSIEKIAAPATEAGPEQDHYSALARMVADVSRDQANLRTFIYEFARIKLRKELYPHFVDGDWSAVEKQLRGLEAAIDRIEANFAQDAPALQFNFQPASADGTRNQSNSSVALLFDSQKTTRFSGEAIPALSLLVGSSPHRSSSVPIVSDGNDRLANAFLGKHLRSSFWRNTQLIVAALIGVAIYVTHDAKDGLDRFGLRWLETLTQNRLTDDIAIDRNPAGGAKQLASKSDDSARQRPVDTSVPTEYGTYALFNGQLTELEQLPLKVPDPRIAISASISVPSRTHLPTGRVEFVIFRRDLTNNAPDRVSVRVVARVRRALTFDTVGKPKTTDVEQSWIIRNNSYQMRVGPFADNPEMIVIRPDPPDFNLPAGRYALVLKGVGYDFTVDGPQTDAAHCLERTDALNAPIYSECPQPQL
jgi:hypothetical protein